MRIYDVVIIDVVGACILHYIDYLVKGPSCLAILTTNLNMTVLGMQVDSHGAFGAKSIPQNIKSQMEESHVQQLANKTQPMRPRIIPMM